MAKGAKSGGRYNKADAKLEAISAVADASGHGMTKDQEKRFDAVASLRGAKAPRAYGRGGKYNIQDLAE